MRLRQWAFLASILLLPLLGGCKKKAPPDVEERSDLAPPSVALQVAGIDPGFAPAGQPLSAEIFGSAFERGAQVSFSGAPAESVQFIDANALRVTAPAMPEGRYDVTVTNPDGTQATLRKGLTLIAASPASAGCRSATIPFEFDSTVLAPEARRVMDALAVCLRDTKASARIEGHCDESGTTDYNLALGQRRADAVSRYLVGLGVSPAKLRTLSFGEERPVDRSGSSAAATANRRAEIQVRE